MLIAEAISSTPLSSLQENIAVSLAGQELRRVSEEDLENTVRWSVFWRQTILLGEAQKRLSELAGLKSNWDSYGAPAPNQIAIANANRVLRLMQPLDLAMSHIVPSAEGGVGFFFTTGQRYADIELANDGEILGVRYAGMDAPVLIDTDGTDDSIEAALEQIRNHILG